MSTVTGGFEVGDWNEETYQELDGDAKLTRASVTQTFTCDIDGQGHVEWLVCYRKDGTALFVGVQRIDGSVTLYRCWSSVAYSRTQAFFPSRCCSCPGASITPSSVTNSDAITRL